MKTLLASLLLLMPEVDLGPVAAPDPPPFAEEAEEEYGSYDHSHYYFYNLTQERADQYIESYRARRNRSLQKIVKFPAQITIVHDNTRECKMLIKELSRDWGKYLTKSYARKLGLDTTLLRANIQIWDAKDPELIESYDSALNYPVYRIGRTGKFKTFPRKAFLSTTWPFLTLKALIDKEHLDEDVKAWKIKREFRELEHEEQCKVILFEYLNTRTDWACWPSENYHNNGFFAKQKLFVERYRHYRYETGHNFHLENIKQDLGYLPELPELWYPPEPKADFPWEIEHDR